MHTYGKTYYIDIFKENICKVCKLCGPDYVSFCIRSWAADKKRFYETLAYINVLRIKNNDLFKAVLTFEGFCGIFCNTNHPCKYTTPGCKDLEQLIVCYDEFSRQSGKTVTPSVKQEIYSIFSGIPAKKIGEPYKMPPGDPLGRVSKKQRRRIRRSIKAAKNNMRSSFHNYHCGAPGSDLGSKPIYKRKKPTTELFYNDNPEWKAKIDKYLSQDEADN
jgi:hypothetical protein